MSLPIALRRTSAERRAAARRRVHAARRFADPAAALPAGLRAFAGRLPIREAAARRAAVGHGVAESSYRPSD